ncbi:flagellar biosynthetic protein FliO [Hydrogenibacillus sp. N12]|uniref:flagellar biosynthetic protein FliO n=1 Tax=Hydrogenibacillus sp. N12 TaxID=2866627 RepID=UPI001C7DBA3D|nr:flagellar biosynthetic protein FliO [Hydrogenibacillus sp. N12]QZA33512.1 flagellar biosynthetic protein FliO [Hydrogenibacillus sp. N12]
MNGGRGRRVRWALGILAALVVAGAPAARGTAATASGGWAPAAGDMGAAASGRRAAAETAGWIAPAAAFGGAAAVASGQANGGAPSAPGKPADPEETVATWLKRRAAEGDGAGPSSAPSGDARPLADPRTGGPAGPGIAGALKVILALGFVVALLLGLGALVRRLRRAVAFGAFGSEATGLSLKAIQPLAPGRAVAVVEVEGRRYLLGVGEAVTLLDRLADGVAAEAAIQAEPERGWKAEGEEAGRREDRAAADRDGGAPPGGRSQAPGRPARPEGLPALSAALFDRARRLTAQAAALREARRRLDDRFHRRDGGGR